MRPAASRKGRILFRGEDIARASLAAMRNLHGAAISMIFQNPRAALNPIRTVGLQIADAILRASSACRPQKPAPAHSIC